MEKESEEYIENYDDSENTEYTWWDEVVDWIGGHKVIVIISVIGLPILLVWAGAKIFSKTVTNTVEVEKVPDPTIMDKYDRVPISETSTINYEYVLKEEYRNQE